MTDDALEALLRRASDALEKCRTSGKFNGSGDHSYLLHLELDLICAANCVKQGDVHTTHEAVTT